MSLFAIANEDELARGKAQNLWVVPTGSLADTDEAFALKRLLSLLERNESIRSGTHLNEYETSAMAEILSRYIGGTR